MGTFIILKALFISDPSVKLICKAINFINFLSIMPSLQWRILSQEAAAAARVRILENAVLKRSHEKFKISILVYRFLVWIWLGGQDSDSLYQHTAYALHTAHNNPKFNQEKFKSNIKEHFTGSVWQSLSPKWLLLTVWHVQGQVG